MTAVKLAILGLGMLSCAGLARAADNKTHGFLQRTHMDPDGAKARYVLFVPHTYTGEKATSVIVFLHGSGETGSDGERQAQTGLGPAIRKHEKTFPSIVIFPQSQKRTWRADSGDARRALDILAEVEKEYKVDPKRIYLTGLSMGGMGTWSLALAHPERWAAIVPVCGRGDPKKAE